MRSGKQITYEFETKVKSIKRKKSIRQDGKKSNLSYEYLDTIGLFDDDEDVIVTSSVLPESEDEDVIGTSSVLPESEDEDVIGTSSVLPASENLNTFNTQLVDKNDPKSEWCRAQVPYYCGEDSHPSKKGRCARKPKDCKIEGPGSQGKDDSYVYQDLNDDYLYKAMPKEEREKIYRRPAGLESKSNSLVERRKDEYLTGRIDRDFTDDYFTPKIKREFKKGADDEYKEEDGRKSKKVSKRKSKKVFKRKSKKVSKRKSKKVSKRKSKKVSKRKSKKVSKRKSKKN
jgi:hypothetical protein